MLLSKEAVNSSGQCEVKLVTQFQASERALACVSYQSLCLPLLLLLSQSVRVVVQQGHPGVQPAQRQSA